MGTTRESFSREKQVNSPESKQESKLSALNYTVSGIHTVWNWVAQLGKSSNKSEQKSHAQDVQSNQVAGVDASQLDDEKRSTDIEELNKLTQQVSRIRQKYENRAMRSQEQGDTDVAEYLLSVIHQINDAKTHPQKAEQLLQGINIASVQANIQKVLKGEKVSIESVEDKPQTQREEKSGESSLVKGDIGTPEQRKKLVEYLRRDFLAELKKDKKALLVMDDPSYLEQFSLKLLQIAKNIEEESKSIRSFYSEAKLQRELEAAWKETVSAKGLQLALGGTVEKFVETIKQSRFKNKAEVAVQAEQNASSVETEEDIWLTSVKGTLAQVITLKIPESLKQAVRHLLSGTIIESKDLIPVVEALPESDQKSRLATLVNVEANKGVTTLKKDAISAEEGTVILNEEVDSPETVLAQQPQAQDYTLAVDFGTVEKQDTISKKARGLLSNLGSVVPRFWTSSSVKVAEYSAKAQDAISTGTERVKQNIQQMGERISNKVSTAAANALPPDFGYAFNSEHKVDTGVGILTNEKVTTSDQLSAREDFGTVKKEIKEKSQGPFAVLQSKLQSLLNRPKQNVEQTEVTSAQKYDAMMAQYRQNRIAEIRASKISPETLGYAITAKIQKARELDPTKSIALMNELREVMNTRYNQLLASDSPESALKKASEENRVLYQAKLQEAIRLYDEAKIDTQIMNEMKQMSLPASLRGLTTGLQELKKSIDTGYMEVATGKLAEKALTSIAQIRAILNNPNIKLAGSVGAAAALAYMAGHYMGAQEVGTTLSTPPTP